MRGEYNKNADILKSKIGSPPLARGIHMNFSSYLEYIRITPACAGNTVLILKIRCVHQDHPRLRGEYPRRCPCLTKLSGSPPLARGILTDRARGRMENRITPACAGNTELKRESLNEGEDHPRLRGEYCVHQVRESRSPGSPPLARGIHHDRKTDRLDNRITPACAGNTHNGWF